jgi:hypothetical protein
VIELAGHLFENDKASLICIHCENREVINYFQHDEDGYLTFSCGKDNHYSEDDWRLIELEDVIEIYPYVRNLPDVHIGECAERKSGTES